MHPFSKIARYAFTICFSVLLSNAAIASRFGGTWQGSYHTQPTELQPDGSYPENIIAYELQLHESGREISGTLYVRGQKRHYRINHGQRFQENACFDVTVDDSDMRWCVSAHGNRLDGAWNAGPQGGALLNGAGAGVRFFKITGNRVRGKPSEVLR